MRIQPRQQLLDIWRATAQASTASGNPGWTFGGRSGRNSISDAEQLLCIMLPAAEISSFQLHQPGAINAEVVRALRPFGTAANDIVRTLVRAIKEYFTTYALPDGTPTFSGGSSFVSGEGEPTDDQLALDVVESYATSIQLTLAVLSFARRLRPSIKTDEMSREIGEIERLASRRLTAALIGLLRSFTISVFPVDHPYGEALLRSVNQSNQPRQHVVRSLQAALSDIAVRLSDLDVGNVRVEGADDPQNLFECGWTWGIADGSPKVEASQFGGDSQQDGFAVSEPYLYFTVVALDGIAELDSAANRQQRLMNDEQLGLAAALLIRWELTQSYWATIASFGAGRWPLEDIPWRTTDAAESDYFTLLVTSIAARALASRRGSDADLGRLGSVLVELANRGRLTRRSVSNDPATGLHVPGVPITLGGSEKMGPQLSWVGTDYAPLLLKRVVEAATLINDVERRSDMLGLADAVFDHVSGRRLLDGAGRDLWDQPALVFPGVSTTYTQPSWHHTARMVESLVFAARLAETDPLRNERLQHIAEDLLAEAEHLFDREQMAGSTEAGLALRTEMEKTRQRIRRARDILTERPGTAQALLIAALADLDGLAAAGEDTPSGFLGASL